jgi:hypothetical protein
MGTWQKVLDVIVIVLALLAGIVALFALGAWFTATFG